jgi:hypothetical protein
MSKTGIVMYIFGFIFVVFCFWFVGCSDESTSTKLDSEDIYNDSLTFTIINR